MTTTHDPPDKANLIIMAGFILFFVSLLTPSFIYRTLWAQGIHAGYTVFFSCYAQGGWVIYTFKPPTILIMLTIMLTGLSLILIGFKKKKPPPKPTKKKGKK